MKRGTKRSRLLPFTISAALLAAAAALSSGILVSVQAAPTPGYKLSTVGAYGGEPSIASDSLGRLYDTTPSGGTLTYTSANHGSTWSQVHAKVPNVRCQGEAVITGRSSDAKCHGAAVSGWSKSARRWTVFTPVVAFLQMNAAANLSVCPTLG